MNRFPETRVSLIVRLAEPADVQAWHEFAEIYAPCLYTLALRYRIQPADAEDVTQEILFAVARAMERFDPSRKDATFRTWLSRIARNQIADHFRKIGKLPTLVESPEAYDLHGDSNPILAFEKSLEQEYQLSLFQRAARVVKERVQSSTWEAFERTTVQGHASGQVAEQLSMALGSVYVARSRVMKLLRTEVLRLEKLFEGHDSLPDSEPDLQNAERPQTDPVTSDAPSANSNQELNSGGDT